MVKNWRKFAAPSGVVLAALMGMTAAAPDARADDAQSYMAHAKALLAKGDLKGAEIELRNAVRVDPNDASAHVDLARLYFQADNLPAAEAEARLARQDKASPDDVDPALARTLAAQTKFNALFDLIKPGKRSPKAESDVRLQLGLAHLTLGEVTEAEPLLRDAERLDGTSVGAKVGMARLLMQKGDIDGATAELARARTLAPDDLSMLRLSAEVVFGKGDRAGALAQFGAILAKHPDDVQTLLDRANVLMSVSKLDEAKKDLDHALKLQPKNLVGNFLYALYLAKKGELKQADDQLTAISEYFNAFPDGYYLEGAVQYALGEYAEAEANLTKYAVRNPTFTPARRILALIAARNRNWQGVIDTLTPVVEAHTADTAAIALLARAYVATGKRDQAAALFQKAAQATADQQVQTQLALMEMQVGETAEGLTKLKDLAGNDKGADIAGPALIITDLRSGRVSEAATEAQALIKRNPKDVLAQNLLGVVRMTQRNYAEAAKIFAGIVQSDANLGQAARNLAKADTALGRTDEAKKIWENVLQKDPNDVEALVSLAGIAAQAKDFHKANDLLTKAQHASPKNPEPGIARIELFAAQKDWEKATAAARDVEGQFPANAQVITAVAAMRAAAGDRKGAADEYQKLTQAFPKSATAFARYGQAQLAAGDKAGALATFATALSLAPKNPALMQDLVDIDYDTKGANAALATAQSFAQGNPGPAALLEANVLVKAGRRDDAIAVLAKEQQQRPNTQVLIRLAQLTYLGHPKDAQGMLVSWLKDHDADQAARQELANMELAQHDNDAALKNYQQISDAAPNDPIALNNLAWLYDQKGDPRAYDLAERAYYLAPTPDRADTIGWILVRRGDAAAGLSYLQEAGAGSPQNLTIQYHLAVALNDTGAKDAARAALERVMKTSSQFDGRADAQKLLDELQRG